MRITLNIISALFLFFLVYGCNEDEFLTEAPISELSTKSFFETSDQFEQAVNASYTNLLALAGNDDVGSDGAFWAMGEMRSDNTTYQYNTTDQSGHIYWHLDKFIMDAENGIVSVAWNNCYQGIGKCNIVLKFSEEVEYENQDRCLAEVKFLRALYYFTLVKAFGDVPLVTEPATSYTSAFEGNQRVSTDLVYEQILTDLNEAIQNLPQSYSSSSDLGRATKGAARTLLAKVLMWNDRYDEAATELETVISSNQYALLDDYASVFSIDNENNEEIVFSVQNIEGTYGLGSANMYRFTPWNAGTEYISFGQKVARTGMNIPTEDLINSFETGDKRFALIDTAYVDEDFGTYNGNIVPFTRKFWDPDHAVQYVTGNDFPLFRYPHVLLMLAECYVRESSGDPVPLVNQVRARAGLLDLSSVTLDDIFQERRIEFYCEADRWDVLVRTGEADEVMKAHGEDEKASRPIVITSTAFNTINHLFPIPSGVLETDPTMEQNPEYQ